MRPGDAQAGRRRIAQPPSRRCELVQHGLMLGGSGGPPAQPGITTAWNPVYAGAPLQFSDQNRTVWREPAPTPEWHGVLATTARDSGRRYFECAWPVGDHVAVGVGALSSYLDGWVGTDIYSWGWLPANPASQRLCHDNVFTACDVSAVSSEDSVLGVGVDFSAGTMSIWKITAGDDFGGGLAFTGLSGALYPMAAIEGTAPTSRLTLNCGQEPFRYLPTGYEAWG